MAAQVRRKDSSGWYWKNQPEDVSGGGLECCSARPVLFHGFKHKDGYHVHMYALHAMLYSVKVADRPRDEARAGGEGWFVAEA